jgi:putative peptidoglycan lipid II flippase
MSPKIGMEGFAWGVLVGAFVGNFALQWWGARRVGMTFQPLFNFRHPDLKYYIILTLPLMAGLTMMFSMEIFIRFFGAYLEPGSVASLNYSRTILLIPVGLFGQAIGVASYPFMARLVAENKMQEMNDLLNGALRYLALVIPLSVLFIVTRYEIVQILFERGRFDSAATTMTAHILLFLLPGAFALSAYTVVVRGYYASQNTWFPAIFGTIAVIFSLPIYWYGMKMMGAGGIGMAISISSIIQVGTLYALWNHQTRNLGSRKVYIFYLQMIFLSAILGAVLEYLRQLLVRRIDATTDLGSFVIIAIIGTVFAITLFCGGRLLGIKEIDDLSKRVFKRISR